MDEIKYLLIRFPCDLLLRKDHIFLFLYWETFEHFHMSIVEDLEFSKENSFCFLFFLKNHHETEISLGAVLICLAIRRG
jgi:hypothetical protein